MSRFASLSHRLIVALGLTVVCLGPCDASAGPDRHHAAGMPMVLPASTGTGHVLVQAYLNGSGPYWCLLDTGNTNTTIFRSLADALELEVEPHGEMIGLGEGTLPVGRASGLRVEMRSGPAAAAIDEALVTVLPDEARLPPFGEHSIDAILGGTLLDRFVVQIDYRGSTVTLHDPATYKPPADAPSLRIGLTAGFPHVRGSVTALIDGSASRPIEGEFLIDLGSGIGLDVKRSSLEKVADLERPIDGRRVVGQISGIDGEPMDLEAIPAASVRLGGVTLDIGEIMVLPIDGGGPPINDLVGSLGGAAFFASGITLNYRDRVVYLH